MKKVVQKTLFTASTLVLALSSSMATAGTATNTMTNIVTLADACDIVAIGLDFGISSAPIPPGGILATALQANTTAGNLITGNTSHPDAASDGGAQNDDELTLITPLGALTGVVSSALSVVVGAVPGVHVACTTSPTSVSLTSSTGSTPFQLYQALTPPPLSVGTLAGAPVGTFSGTMTGVGGGASATNTINYELTFTGVSLAVGGTNLPGLPAIFVGEYLVLGGAIPGTQTGTVVPGFYSDVATAQVDF